MRSSSIVAVLMFAASAAAQATRWVSPTGSNANPGTFALPLQTINHANSLSVAGDTIRLHPGVYGDEQGTIVLGDRDITVLGAGAGSSIVRAHSTLTTNVPTGFPALPVATQQRCVVLVQGAASVDLRALTIDGNFAVPASGRLTGVYYRDGADGLVSGVEIRNCRANPLGGGQGLAGLVVRGDNGGDPCNVTLHDCRLHDFGKAGAVAFFHSHLVVKDCQVVGADHLQSGAAQVGVQISYDASGEVRRSTITDLYYDPAGTVATGILCFDADNSVVLEDNAIANCEHAIYVFGSSNTSLAATVRRNRVVACDAGVYLDNISGVSVIDNHLQLSLDLFANAGFSNTAGNTWTGNNYSSYPGAGSYTIPGGGGNVDGTPRRGVDLLGAPVATALPFGHIARGLVAADLDGAGSSDFATVDENAGVSVSIGLNTGGAFAVSTVPLALTGRAIAIVAAELNNAPGKDLAVLLQVTTPALGARVFTLANNGAGAFTVIGNHFLSGTQPSSLCAGDINGDGVADLMVANVGSFGGGDAILLANLPAYGTNYSQALLPGFGYYSSPVRGVAFGDITGDGFLDALVTEGNSSFGRVHVFANNGSGGFAATGYSPLYLRNDPTAVAATDLDGDGDKDMLVSYGTTVNSTPGGVAVFENLGGGSFRKSFYNSDFSTNALAVGNIDEDSDPDSTFGDAAVVNTDGGTITVLAGYVRGAGFNHGGIAVNATQSAAIAFGDFDGDTFHDLFYTNGFGGQVLVKPGRPSARTDYYGYSSAGFRSKVPHIAPVGAPGVPTQPNLTLAVELSNCQTFTLAAFVGSLAPAAVLAPNDLQVDLGLLFMTAFGVTDINGRISTAFALPPTPSIHGLAVYFQGGVFDGAGGYVGFPGVALSNGMKLRIGR